MRFKAGLIFLTQNSIIIFEIFSVFLACKPERQAARKGAAFSLRKGAAIMVKHSTLAALTLTHL